MESLENDGSSKQTSGNNAQEEANIYEDEINLIDYFFVLWKHKWLIFLGSVLPALIVGLILFLSPKNYEVTYVYNVSDDVREDASSWSLNEKNYNILISRFYSEENLNKIINKLRENGLNQYAELISITGNNLDNLKELLKFEPVPPYIDISKAKVTDPEQLKQIRKLTAQLLNMTIVGKPKKDILKIASVIRENLENVIPVYMVQEQLAADIRTYKTRMSDIESNRFSTVLTLKTNKSALEKLKSMKPQTTDKIEKDIILQFDVGGRSEYLPLRYQIQAVVSNIVELEKQVKVNEAKYKYYKDLLDLTEKLSVELKNRISSYYTIQQFHSFLTELIGNYKAAELKDYLASYIKKIENRISANTLVSQNPNIFPIAKGTTKKSAIVFVVALMMSVFMSCLIEGIQKSKAQAF